MNTKRLVEGCAALLVLASVATSEPARGDEPTAPPPPRIRFVADPIADPGIVVLGASFTFLSAEIISTGEIRPQPISPSFRSSQLLGIDRGAIKQKLDSNAGTFSNIGLWTAVTYAVADVVLDFFRESFRSAIVDAFMYAEAAAVTQSVTNIAKIAFRRPRPIAYIERQAYLDRGGDPSTYDNRDTDSALSFFSGHASGVASLSAAATYIAFARSPGSVRPWLTLAGATALTTFVAYERVRAGAHFPTDVIAGALAGTAVGSLVVHLHRADDLKERTVWIGALPAPGGGMLGVSGVF